MYKLTLLVELYFSSTKTVWTRCCIPLLNFAPPRPKKGEKGEPSPNTSCLETHFVPFELL